MSIMSDLDLQLQEINKVMQEPNPLEVSVDLTMVRLMTATEELFEFAASKTTEPLVRLNANDIELAYVSLGRLLSRLRQSQLQAAE